MLSKSARIKGPARIASIMIPWRRVVNPDFTAEV
jgi:hypothetical protein